MQFETYIGDEDDGIFAIVEITDFTPDTRPPFNSHPECDDGEPATVEWRFVDVHGNRDDDMHAAATEADIERIDAEAVDVAESMNARHNRIDRRSMLKFGQYMPTY